MDIGHAIIIRPLNSIDIAKYGIGSETARMRYITLLVEQNAAFLVVCVFKINADTGRGISIATLL